MDKNHACAFDDNRLEWRLSDYRVKPISEKGFKKGGAPVKIRLALSEWRLLKALSYITTTRPHMYLNIIGRRLNNFRFLFVTPTFLSTPLARLKLPKRSRKTGNSSCRMKRTITDSLSFYLRLEAIRQVAAGSNLNISYQPDLYDYREYFETNWQRGELKIKLSSKFGRRFEHG